MSNGLGAEANSRNSVSRSDSRSVESERPETQEMLEAVTMSGGGLGGSLMPKSLRAYGRSERVSFDYRVDGDLNQDVLLVSELEMLTEDTAVAVWFVSKGPSDIPLLLNKGQSAVMKSLSGFSTNTNLSFVSPRSIDSSVHPENLSSGDMLLVQSTSEDTFGQVKDYILSKSPLQITFEEITEPIVADEGVDMTSVSFSGLGRGGLLLNSGRDQSVTREVAAANIHSHLISALGGTVEIEKFVGLNEKILKVIQPKSFLFQKMGVNAGPEEVLDVAEQFLLKKGVENVSQAIASQRTELVGEIKTILDAVKKPAGV